MLTDEEILLYADDEADSDLKRRVEDLRLTDPTIQEKINKMQMARSILKENLKDQFQPNQIFLNRFMAQAQGEASAAQTSYSKINEFVKGAVWHRLASNSNWVKIITGLAASIVVYVGIIENKQLTSPDPPVALRSGSQIEGRYNENIHFVTPSLAGRVKFSAIIWRDATKKGSRVHKRSSLKGTKIHLRFGDSVRFKFQPMTTGKYRVDLHRVGKEPIVLIPLGTYQKSMPVYTTDITGQPPSEKGQIKIYQRKNDRLFLLSVIPASVGKN